MRLFLFLSVSLLFKLSVHAQGTILLANMVEGLFAAPAVMRSPGYRGPPLGGWTVQLYASGVPLVPTTTFRSDFAAYHPYFVPVVVTVPGVGPGETTSTGIRVYFNAYSSFESAPEGARSFLTAFDVTLGTPESPALLSDLEFRDLAMNVVIPEPQVVGLTVLGLGIFLCRRLLSSSKSHPHVTRTTHPSHVEIATLNPNSAAQFSTLSLGLVRL